MILPPDFKKKLTKIIQDQTDSQRRADRSVPSYASTVSLESAIPGQAVAVNGGEFYMVRRKLSDLYIEADALAQTYCKLFTLPWNSRQDPGDSLHNDFRDLLDTDPAKVMFLDAETAGLSNTPLFLLGLMYFNGENLVIDQLFARDYSEEANVLQYFSNLAPEFDTLVTFNGKSFDARFIMDRMIYHRKRFRWSQTHVDILHHSRRRWKSELPDCKLQTLESHICDRRRVGDVPGELVPEVYREFVRSGDTRLLADVFHHNALDLITLVELTVVLLS